jgi:hypothetical protein
VDDLINTTSGDIRRDSLERREVAVYVGYHREPHRRLSTALLPGPPL